MNNRNINAAGKPQTIRTTLEKLSVQARRSAAARRADSYRRHIGSFTGANLCYAHVNGFAMPVPMG